MLRDKAIPLYYQLETILRKKIISGDYQPDEILPSEEMLATEYKVSRITVRQALASLEQEDLVVRQRGKGTFVTDNAAMLQLPKFSGSIEDLIMMGIQTQIEVLDISWIEASETIKEELNINHEERALRIEKVRAIEGAPFSHVYNYLPPDIGKRLPTDLVESKPMLMILEDELDIRVNEAVQSVEGTIADAQQASILRIRVGDPLLKAERTIYDIENQPVEYVEVVYRADKYAYNMKLKRNRTKKSAGWDAL